MKRGKIDFIAVIVLIIASILLFALAMAINSGTNGNANIIIYTSGTFNKLNLTSGSIYSKTASHWNFYFYSNFTNSTGALNSTHANCTLRFNETGVYGNWNNFTYNSTSFLWEYNRSFIYKGNLSFQANCTSSSGNISLEDYFYIRNTPPYVDLLSTIQFYQNESNGTYSSSNFSEYVTENDVNDNLTYSIENITSARYSETSANFYYWVLINSSTGLIYSNATYDNQTDNFYLTIKAADTGNNGLDVEPIMKGVYFNVTAVNDAPEIEVENKTLPVLDRFEYIIPIVDEEGNLPYFFNITFIGCSVAQWSTRNSTLCVLFNSSQWSTNGTAINISFIPSRNDVGNYTINFTVIDSGVPNATTSVVVNFSVTNSNLPPFFTYLCNNFSISENSNFTCFINASDSDETLNLGFSANYSWFKFNLTNSNSVSVPVNITTRYNASVLVNFTPTDSEVGNWSVNISVTDTPGAINSSVFWFFIDNAEDSVSLNSISNITIYENITLYVNATDNDLLVPDKNVKNETISFVSDTSWVSVSSAYSASNYATVRIEINYNQAAAGQNYTARITASDTGANIAERYFQIQVLGDNAPQWLNPQTNIAVYENNYTYLNLSQNVSDSEGDNINFSFINNTSFPAFSLNSSTGIVNFTPADLDVGYHNVTINASDGKLNSLKGFNFTVYNVDDAPYIEGITDQTANEDTAKSIQLYIQDEDLKIPQTGFYYENFSINITFQGSNTNLFNFSLFNRTLTSNKSYYLASFTPRKADAGSYNITLNATDTGNFSYKISFNLTISAINHAPSLMNFTNYTSKINSSFYLQINASDIEDGNSTAGNTNFTFLYSFLSGTSFANATTFNATSGIINISLNDSHAGKYRINISVSDSMGKNSSGNFWLFIYNNPQIIIPPSTYQFRLFEANNSNLTFKANHSVMDNLTYYFYIDRNNSRELRYNLSYYGNNTNLTWRFYPNYTDETYGITNLTLLVLNPLYPELNSSVSWNLTINHTNYPVNFSGYIGDKEATYSSTITILLGTYFSDIDYSDAAYNQTINFNATSNSTPSIISSSFSGNILTLSASSAASEIFRITAYDLNLSNATMSNISSNTFLVTFTNPQTVPTPSPGGGGGGTTVKLEHYSIKIISPGDVIISDKNYIEIPIVIQNTGQVNLKGISLSGIVSFNNILSDDLKLTFANSQLNELGFGQSANVTLRILTDTQKAGKYKATIFANVTAPKFSDWGDFFIDLRKTNETEADQMLVFTQKMISENPECIELTELLKEAKKLFEQSKYPESKEKAQEAVTACEEAISKNPVMGGKTTFVSSTLIYAGLGIILVFVLWIIIYIYKKVKFNKDRWDGYV